MVNKWFVLEFLLIHAWVAGVIAAPHVSYITTTDQQQIRLARWESQAASPKKTLIFILPGLGEMLERYHETAEDFSRRGYTVVIIDWRGQGGSSRQTRIKTLAHVPDFGYYLKDLKTIFETFAHSQKIFLVGNSMGGHLALRYIQENGIDPRFIGVILTAPMVQIKTGAYPWPVARTVSWVVNKVGQSERFAFGYKPFNLHECRQRNQEHVCQLQVDRPDLAFGGPSFGWLEAAFQSMAALQQPKKVARINLPVLMISAAEDRVVENEAQKDLCERLPKCRLLVYDKARHNLFGEKKEIATQLRQDIDGFIQEVTENRT